MILAEIIKNRRIALGYSLRNLANEVGISHTELVRIENGKIGRASCRERV